MNPENTQNTAENQDYTGDINPNLKQQEASHPEHSVWVGASAGTGKTKVLTDRVLRLLLPRARGQDGTPPNRILCLTFTKAAANEMAVRINKTLGSWAVMDIDHEDAKKSLRQVLTQLLGYVPTEAHINAAKRLFADVIDCPGGIQIMTIHSFCQSVLGRFPIEAGLPPNFSVIEEAETSELMRQAQSRVVEISQTNEYAGAPLGDAVNHIIGTLDEQTFSTLMRQICKEKYQFQALTRQYGSVEGIYAVLCDVYKIAQNLKPYAVIENFCAEALYDEQGLRYVAEALLQDKGKTAPQRAAVMLQWLNSDADGRMASYEIYKTAFLTGGGTIHKQAFPPAAVDKQYPDAKDILHREAERILAVENTQKCIKSAAMTRDLLLIGQEVMAAYDRLKILHGGLDFDDLINRTMTLLIGETSGFSHLEQTDRTQIMPWILYKLDQGIDHVLVDEAQDTNPEQWKIIATLSDEFFAGLSARDDVLRTAFTVGDIKQSIYGFQRAAPEEFKRMQKVFDEKINNAGLVNKNIALDISFRSTQSVLHVVDAVFKNPVLLHAVGEGHVHHETFRQGQEGVVELWPLFETEKPEQRDFWDPPVLIQNHKNGASDLAGYIATQIRGALDRKEVLSSHNRLIQPKDFMILVRSRTAFVEQMVRALKALDVPVSGVDRMMLKDQLAVQDLLSVARFCLLPDDDLTLAEVLKSPFIGWSEEELFSLSYGRKGTLWQEICNFDHAKIDAIPEAVARVSEDKRMAAQDYLSRLMGRARVMGAYEFFAHILTQRCPADDYSGLRAVCKRLGEDAFDPIGEMMNAALDFSHDNTDHLQLFLDYQEHRDTEIKREQEDTTNQVRIMTVHGAKGLQAPIVILPDTTVDGAAKKTGRFLWPEKTKATVPVYSARKDDDPALYCDLYDTIKQQDEEEYYRLLYVAMTRATDRLYIAGYAKKNKPKEHSWYFMVQNAMEQDAAVQQMEDGVLRIANPQTAPPDKSEKKSKDAPDTRALPAWVYQQAGDEPFPPRPLVPSRPSDDEDIVMAPLKAAENGRFLRGNITHKLLEFLPSFPVENRYDAAVKYAHKNAADFSEDVRDNIVAEVMGILEHPEYRSFFKEGSMAEVPLSGLMPDNRIISGQIDRLVIEERDIWILDYKTNRPPPKDANNIPAIYRKQMIAYRDAIQKIYPDHTIHCGFLWTDGPNLMMVDL
tara:strand:- start:1081 stop:4653 length:3573 start_codon:yes stop_codon:yes gene_type:complete